MNKKLIVGLCTLVLTSGFATALARDRTYQESSAVAPVVQTNVTSTASTLNQQPGMSPSVEAEKTTASGTAVQADPKPVEAKQAQPVFLTPPPVFSVAPDAQSVDSKAPSTTTEKTVVAAQKAS